MIRHFVILRFRPDISAVEKGGLFDELSALRDRIPGIVGFHAGPNVSVETDLIRGNEDAFWIDFADEATRDTYLADEMHADIGRRIVERTVDGIDGVTVVDLMLPEAPATL
jgi:hypothetical protein